MNRMNSREDEKWQGLLLRSAPTFAGEADAALWICHQHAGPARAENRQQEEIERIGWRALLASLAALVIAATVTLSVSLIQDRGAISIPGVRASFRWKISRSRENTMPMPCVPPVRLSPNLWESF